MNIHGTMINMCAIAARTCANTRNRNECTRRGPRLTRQQLTPNCSSRCGLVRRTGSATTLHHCRVTAQSRGRGARTRRVRRTGRCRHGEWPKATWLGGGILGLDGADRLCELRCAAELCGERRATEPRKLRRARESELRSAAWPYRLLAKGRHRKWRGAPWRLSKRSGGEGPYELRAAAWRCEGTEAVGARRVWVEDWHGCSREQQRRHLRELLQGPFQRRGTRLGGRGATRRLRCR